jgi:hypothetical protein
MAERSKALDWNSSNILTGVRGFESHSLRHLVSENQQLIASKLILPHIRSPINSHLDRAAPSKTSASSLHRM